MFSSTEKYALATQRCNARYFIWVYILRSRADPKHTVLNVGSLLVTLFGPLGPTRLGRLGFVTLLYRIYGQILIPIPSILGLGLARLGIFARASWFVGGTLLGVLVWSRPNLNASSGPFLQNG